MFVFSAGILAVTCCMRLNERRWERVCGELRHNKRCLCRENSHTCLANAGHRLIYASGPSCNMLMSLCVFKTLKKSEVGVRVFHKCSKNLRIKEMNHHLHPYALRSALCSLLPPSGESGELQPAWPRRLQSKHCVQTMRSVCASALFWRQQGGVCQREGTSRAFQPIWGLHVLYLIYKLS